LDQLTHDLKIQEAQNSAEAIRSKAKKVMAEDKERKERKRLKKLQLHTKAEIGHKERNIAEATREHMQNTKQRAALIANLRSCYEKAAALEKKVNKWKSRAKSDVKVDKKSWEDLEKEKAKIKSMRNCTKELAKYKAWAKAQDKELKELKKWKASVQTCYDEECIELKKLKLAIKVSKASEKKFEQQIKKLEKCRSRTKNFDKQLKELR